MSIFRKINLKEIIKGNNFKRGIIFLCSFSFIYMVLFTALISQKYTLNVGDIAKTAIKAPREVEDKLNTEAKINQASMNVGLQYSKKTEVKSKVLKDIKQMFVILSDSKLKSDEKINKIKSDLLLDLSENDFSALLLLKDNDLKILEASLSGVISDLYDNINIEEAETDNQGIEKASLKKAKEYIADAVSDYKLSDLQSSLIINISNLEIRPNFIYDKDKTEELQKDAKDKVQKIMIKKDQIIVKEGEPVTVEEIQVLKDLGLLNNNKNFDWYINICLAVLVVFILILQWGYLYHYNPEIYNDHKKMILINLLTFIALIFARTLNVICPFIIPFACAPLMLSLIFNHKTAVTLSTLNCIFISVVVGFNVQIIIIAIFNAVIGSVIIKKMYQRSDIMYTALYLSVLNFIIAFTTGFLLNNNVLEVFMTSGITITSSVFSAVLTIGFLPFFESFFDIVTIIKLLELSNPNSPLLKRLLLEAPGTYHHSLLVANLAEVAAEAAGGNAVLTRVSAYYHDVGKIKRPYFFKENQIGNDNPHNKITPDLSTLIITSHIKDGIELAEEYKLPKIIRDMIEQHHGTSLVKYFYIIMKNSTEDPEKFNKEYYKYPGPRPKSKEAGILMLADSVEAAVRSINDPTSCKIEEMVNNIIKERLNDGQLDNCDLTLKDLDMIKASFLKSLSGIYHKRIEYPKEK